MHRRPAETPEKGGDPILYPKDILWTYKKYPNDIFLFISIGLTYVNPKIHKETLEIKIYYNDCLNDK